jgi:hypothetical protein
MTTRGIDSRSAPSGRAWLSLLAAIVPAAIFWGAELEGGGRLWLLLLLWLAGAVAAVVVGRAALLESWHQDRLARTLPVAALILGGLQLPAALFVSWIFWQDTCFFCLW